MIGTPTRKPSSKPAATRSLLPTPMASATLPAVLTTEYAVEYLASTVLLVLGLERCGAVTAGCGGKHHFFQIHTAIRALR